MVIFEVFVGLKYYSMHRQFDVLSALFEPE